MCGWAPSGINRPTKFLSCSSREHILHQGCRGSGSMLAVIVSTLIGLSALAVFSQLSLYLQADGAMRRSAIEASRCVTPNDGYCLGSPSQSGGSGGVFKWWGAISRPGDVLFGVDKYRYRASMEMADWKLTGSQDAVLMVEPELRVPVYKIPTTSYALTLNHVEKAASLRVNAVWPFEYLVPKATFLSVGKDGKSYDSLFPGFSESYERLFEDAPENSWSPVNAEDSSAFTKVGLEAQTLSGAASLRGGGSAARLTFVFGPYNVNPLPSSTAECAKGARCGIASLGSSSWRETAHLALKMFTRIRNQKAHPLVAQDPKALQLESQGVVTMQIKTYSKPNADPLSMIAGARDLGGRTSWKVKEGRTIDYNLWLRGPTGSHGGGDPGDHQDIEIPRGGSFEVVLTMENQTLGKDVVVEPRMEYFYDDYNLSTGTDSAQIERPASDLISDKDYCCAAYREKSGALNCPAPVLEEFANVSQSCKVEVTDWALSCDGAYGTRTRGREIELLKVSDVPLCVGGLAQKWGAIEERIFPSDLQVALRNKPNTCFESMKSRLKWKQQMDLGYLETFSRPTPSSCSQVETYVQTSSCPGSVFPFRQDARYGSPQQCAGLETLRKSMQANVDNLTGGQFAADGHPELIFSGNKQVVFESEFHAASYTNKSPLKYFVARPDTLDQNALAEESRVRVGVNNVLARDVFLRLDGLAPLFQKEDLEFSDAKFETYVRSLGKWVKRDIVLGKADLIEFLDTSAFSGEAFNLRTRKVDGVFPFDLKESYEIPWWGQNSTDPVRWDFDLDGRTDTICEQAKVRSDSLEGALRFWASAQFAEAGLRRDDKFVYAFNYEMPEYLGREKASKGQTHIWSNAMPCTPFEINGSESAFEGWVYLGEHGSSGPAFCSDGTYAVCRSELVSAPSQDAVLRDDNFVGAAEDRAEQLAIANIQGMMPWVKFNCQEDQAGCATIKVDMRSAAPYARTQIRYNLPLGMPFRAVMGRDFIPVYSHKQEVMELATADR